jgi:hypothetical protein
MISASGAPLAGFSHEPSPLPRVNSPVLIFDYNELTRKMRFGLRPHSQSDPDEDMGTLERRSAIPLRMTDAAVQKDRTLKRHWGRLLWVAVTNLPVIVFSIYVLNGVYQDDIRNSLGNPPHPSFWDVIHDNPSYAIALFLAGIGLLLETIRRREAGFVNCGLWLMVSIYSIAVSEPIASRAVVI